MNAITTSPIPDSLSYEQAAVLPLSISTAAAGLYRKGYLELPYPTTKTKPSGKTILVWGGSSSVGSSVIQLAIASGLTVVSTAGKNNIEYVKSLGAKHVFDHADSKVVEDILAVLKGTEFVGTYDAVSLPDTLKASIEITHELGGGKVATVLTYTGDLPSDVTTHQGKFMIRAIYLSSSTVTFSPPSSRSYIYCNGGARSRESGLGEVYPTSFGERFIPGEAGPYSHQGWTFSCARRA